jgi:hypothetical protein
MANLSQANPQITVGRTLRANRRLPSCAPSRLHWSRLSLCRSTRVRRRPLHGAPTMAAGWAVRPIAAFIRGGSAWPRSRGSAATARLINSSFSPGARSAGPTAGSIINEGRGQRTKFLSGQRTRCAAEKGARRDSTPTRRCLFYRACCVVSVPASEASTCPWPRVTAPWTTSRKTTGLATIFGTTTATSAGRIHSIPFRAAASSHRPT